MKNSFQFLFSDEKVTIFTHFRQGSLNYARYQCTRKTSAGCWANIRTMTNDGNFRGEKERREGERVPPRRDRGGGLVFTLHLRIYPCIHGTALQRWYASLPRLTRPRSNGVRSNECHQALVTIHHSFSPIKHFALSSVEKFSTNLPTCTPTCTLRWFHDVRATLNPRNALCALSELIISALVHYFVSLELRDFEDKVKREMFISTLIYRAASTIVFEQVSRGDVLWTNWK